MFSPTKPVKSDSSFIPALFSALVTNNMLGQFFFICKSLIGKIDT